VTEKQLHRPAIPPHVLAETTIGSAKVTGYYEGDSSGRHHFQQPPEQQLCLPPAAIVGQRYLGERFQIAGGQMWSLVTESRKGIANRQEAFPLMIDPQYVVAGPGSAPTASA